jgi:hypothetical protein
MHMKDRSRDAAAERKQDEERDTTDTRSQGDGSRDMREVNENIRKSQGDDAGIRPAIDRHR